MQTKHVNIEIMNDIIGMMLLKLIQKVGKVNWLSNIGSEDSRNLCIRFDCRGYFFKVKKKFLSATSPSENQCLEVVI